MSLWRHRSHLTPVNAQLVDSSLNTRAVGGFGADIDDLTRRPVRPNSASSEPADYGKLTLRLRHDDPFALLPPIAPKTPPAAPPTNVSHQQLLINAVNDWAEKMNRQGLVHAKKYGEDDRLSAKTMARIKSLVDIRNH